LGTFLIVLLIVLLLFSDRLAGLGAGLGEGVKNFKRSVRNEPSSGTKAPPVVALAAKATVTTPKLLPAKGETTPGSDESQTGGERDQRKA